MVKSEVDEAFEWTVLIIAVVSAIMIQYPDYFYTLTPGPADPSLKASKALVIPLVLLIIIWLIAKLAISRRVQVFSKVFAWMLVIGFTWANLYQYMLGLIYASGIHYEIGITNDIAVLSGMIGIFLIDPAVTYFVIVPRYRESYPDSTLLRSKTKFIITYIIAMICVMLLAIGLNS
jgi:hypothetical protein